MSASTSLGVQIVVYENEPDGQVRLAEGLATTLRRAIDAGAVERVSVRWGDCSPLPVLAPDAVDALRLRLSDVTAEVDVECFGDNLGSAGGSNALAARGSEDVIWVLNPDTYPSPRTAERLLAALARPGVAAAEARQLPIEHPKEYDSVSGETGWASGFCTMLRRTAFEEVDGFDAHFFPMYCDDVDLSWRLRLAGHRVVHVDEAAVFHDKRIGGEGGVEMSDFAVFDSARARLFLARRYGRPDVEAELLAWVDGHGTPAHRRAAAEFRQRVSIGDVPEVIEGASTVAVFEGADYAHHRFGYDVAVVDST
ncbi:MAG TPA: glycosyltransferase family 2 protein [Ilumatobacteraceae bacterium]|nr:glycosyltransferase family 2 protein [Ilumatobacteraceae bacterium]